MLQSKEPETDIPSKGAEVDVENLEDKISEAWEGMKPLLELAKKSGLSIRLQFKNNNFTDLLSHPEIAFADIRFQWKIEP